MPAVRGAASIGIRIFERKTPPLTDEMPAPTMAAPMRPPKSACDELDGSP
jgi:hypothetical protein